MPLRCRCSPSCPPAQKARIVRLLRENGHCVGYMGDGINDAAALRAADVSISVDTAVDIAKESASIVLLDKDLMVLEQGLIEGRKTYANMMKYIKMTVSSNFGNMLSVLAASAFLPFLPMTALQLILLNLVYDLSCTAISWDNVDEEYLRKPCRWDAGGVARFMAWNGPVSSLFDLLTFALMYFVFCPASAGGKLYTQLTDPAARELWAALFQTGWFVASMWTQTLVIHMVRTAKVPLLQSRASASLTGLTLAGMAVVTVLPFTPLAEGLGLTALPARLLCRPGGDRGGLHPAGEPGQKAVSPPLPQLAVKRWRKRGTSAILCPEHSKEALYADHRQRYLAPAGGL